MGKGDRRTAKGKRNISSYGNIRSHAASKATAVTAAAKPKSPVAKKASKKAATKKA